MAVSCLRSWVTCALAAEISLLWVESRVETTQIAPTILKLLGLRPDQLKSVQIEHTAVLPGLKP